MAAAADAPLGPRDVGHGRRLPPPARLAPRRPAARRRRRARAAHASSPAPPATRAPTPRPSAGVRRIAPDAPAPPPFDPHAVVGADRTRLVLASDADDEVRVAVRAVVDAVRAGTPLDRIAVLYASAEPYARLVHEHLAAAGITTNGPAVVPLAGRVAGRVLLDLLTLPERGFRRQDVFAWLASAPVLLDGQVGADARVGAAVARGRRRRRPRRLGRPPRDARRRPRRPGRAAVAADPDAARVAAGASAQDAARAARPPRRSCSASIDDLAAAGRAPRRWGEHAAWARGRLADAPRRPPAGATAGRRPSARPPSGSSCALDRLAALDGVEGPVALDVFARTLALELESDLGRVGRFGDGVLVGPVTHGRRPRPRPRRRARPRRGHLPRARSATTRCCPTTSASAAGGELPLRRARVDREHRELLAALAGAPASVLGVPRGDLRRSTRAGAVALGARPRVGARRRRRVGRRAPRRADARGSSTSPSFAAGLRRFDLPRHRAGAPPPHACWPPRPRAPPTSPPPTTPSLAAGAAVVAARRSAALHPLRRQPRRPRRPVAGRRAPRRPPASSAGPAARSPTSSQDVLGVERGREPRGPLRDHRRSTGAASSTRRSSGSSSRCSTARRRAARARRAVVDRRPRPPRRDRRASCATTTRRAGSPAGRSSGAATAPRILADLQRFLDARRPAHRRQRRTRPLAAELAFGCRDATVDAVPFDAPRRARRCASGARPTGSTSPTTAPSTSSTTRPARPDDYADLSEDDPDQRGHAAPARRLRRRRPRTTAATPDAAVLAEYWFVTHQGRVRAHRLPDHRRRPRRVSRHARHDRRRHRGRRVRVPPDRASAPPPGSSAPSCDPDGLGVTELRRAWERKRADPALAPYADLAEPLDERRRSRIEEIADG